MSNLSLGRSGKIEISDTLYAILKQWQSDPSYEVSRIGPLEIQIRYRQEGSNSAPRYFLVKISEPV